MNAFDLAREAVCVTLAEGHSQRHAMEEHWPLLADCVNLRLHLEYEQRMRPTDDFSQFVYRKLFGTLQRILRGIQADPRIVAARRQAYEADRRALLNSYRTEEDRPNLEYCVHCGQPLEED